MVVVTAASVQNRDGAVHLLDVLRHRLSRLRFDLGGSGVCWGSHRSGVGPTPLAERPPGDCQATRGH